MTTDERISLDLGPRGYDIVVGAGLIARAGPLLQPVLVSDRAIVVTDETVGGLYGDALAASLAGAGIDNARIVLPAGEGTKDFVHLEQLIDALLGRRIERTTTLVALGGGVIGDLTGLAASIALRGLPFVQIPTTLLAQVDSSVGGKTGINTSHGKNLVGTFYQPRLVLADTETLDSLPQRELLAGYAEVVKYGLIGDADFFDWLVEHGASITAGDATARRHAITTSCRAKARIVAADEREAGPRALLNFGHTFAHALEAGAGYSGALLHGEAVAIGMVLAFELSARRGLCPPEDVTRVRRHLADMGLPTTPAEHAGGGAAALIDHMRADKKVAGGRVTFVLARGIGQAFLAPDVSLAEVEEVLAQAIAA
ncbi:MAG: 3-dehydroquinate synthase [Alphaproteobacteria bacterium]|nr:3-dehydroquinate synthase [Alphaproteobacteria bacterium]